VVQNIYITSAILVFQNSSVAQAANTGAIAAKKVATMTYPPMQRQALKIKATAL
jgi:hypothetical protein